ncbi:hypothetical protein [Acidocella sp.]|jgi:hypothetical protein|uniref:hypothetical protein n=1 Tax=Acidocella sp. TaxID=50710 RepID=UPI002F3F9AAF
MEITDFKISILNHADKSDPENLLLTIGARALVDGIRCGWRAAVSRSGNYDRDLEKAAAYLIAQILRKPRNPVDIVEPPVPQIEIIIPSIDLAEGAVG